MLQQSLFAIHTALIQNDACVHKDYSLHDTAIWMQSPYSSCKNHQTSAAGMTRTWEQQLTAFRHRHLSLTAGNRFVCGYMWTAAAAVSLQFVYLGWAVTDIRMPQSLQPQESAKSCRWNPLTASKQLCEKGPCCIYWHCMWTWAPHTHQWIKCNICAAKPF